MSQTTIKNRQIAGGLDGWIPAEQTWTYASATTITVPSGAASKYQKGDKIKITNNSATKYFSVVAVADTVLTVRGGSDYTVHDSAITNPYFSKIENPQGFPGYFNATATLASTSGTLTSYTSPVKYKITGRMLHLSGLCTITDKGTGSGVVYINLPVASDGGNACGHGREVGVGGAAVTVLVNPNTAVFYGMSVLNNYATAYSIAYFYT